MAESSAIGASEEEQTSSQVKRGRNLRFSTRENSAFKWKENKSVVGALEVKSEPILDIKADMKKKKVLTMEDEFKQALKLWNDKNLREEFIKACEAIPPVLGCCGLATDYDETIIEIVKTLNKGWLVKVNKEIAEQGYKIDAFEWSWTNPSGKAKTVILLIRFLSLTKERR